MTEANMNRLAVFAIAANNRRHIACANYDVLENSLVREMREHKIRNFEVKGYRISRRVIPIVKCNECQSELPAPQGFPDDYQPERLRIKKLKVIAADSSAESESK
jgi:hypothetical protein